MPEETCSCTELDAFLHQKKTGCRAITKDGGGTIDLTLEEAEFLSSVHWGWRGGWPPPSEKRDLVRSLMNKGLVQYAEGGYSTTPRAQIADYEFL